MGLTIAIAKETASNEQRVAISPDTIKKLKTLQCTINIQTGAGSGAYYTDSAFKNAGATITKTVADTYKNADIILTVAGPNDNALKHAPKSALLIGILSPYSNPDIIQKYKTANISAFNMGFIPRITRAQSMDVLSSQSNLAGYKSVLDAAEHFNRAFPMMMTAAGTIPPTKLFVMGAGVAGLQAIATARRLGAIVSATDVRPASKEQVESLGATFIAIQDDEFKDAETAGGYAKQMSKSYQKKQAALVASHIAKQDIVITTALIPGRPAPKLIDENMVKSMAAGSVIVDLAVETGGNCALAIKDKVEKKYDVTIIGHSNTPSRIATDASALYARNLFNLLKLIINKDNTTLNIDWDDEIIRAIALVKDGEAIHPSLKPKPARKKPAAKKAQKKPSATPKRVTVKKTATKTKKATPKKQTTAVKSSK